jgi:excisionase family DNA binding protein
MFEVQMLIPLADNDGETFTAEHHAAFEAAVIDSFGGFTLYPASAIGGWRNAAGVTFSDATRIYGIAVVRSSMATSSAASPASPRPSTSKRPSSSATSGSSRSSERTGAPKGASFPSCRSPPIKTRSSPMPRTYETLSGHKIEYPDPDAKLERLLKRARELLDDRKATEDDLVVLIYGDENPLLDRTLFPERGMVTKEVLENPAYHVLCDLLARKRAAIKGQTAEQLGRPFTLTVPQAAELLKVSEDTINRGIRARRIPSWVKDGQRYLDPRVLPALDLGTRGKPPPGFERLKVCVGSSHAATFQVKHPGGVLPAHAERIPFTMETTLQRWRQIAVLTGGHDRLRMLVLEPGEKKERFEFEGYFVEGKFSIVKKINDSKAARKAWEGFEAS